MVSEKQEEVAGDSTRSTPSSNSSTSNRDTEVIEEVGGEEEEIKIVPLPEVLAYCDPIHFGDELKSTFGLPSMKCAKCRVTLGIFEKVVPCYHFHHLLCMRCAQDIIDSNAPWQCPICHDPFKVKCDGTSFMSSSEMESIRDNSSENYSFIVEHRY